ncbi:hypothetical protein SAMN05443247_03127 [Bradyrhizobium erythrophlei]|nr:hypothetical protein SAMN05443247_03127 [Bradyrhizobium erythrophlei]
MLQSHRLALSLRGIVFAAMLVLSYGAAFAEEVRIGHLETKDDTGINWLYFRCEKLAATQMRCDVFQTLIMKKKSETEIDTELKRQAATDPLAEFNKGFGDSCKSFVENEGKIKAGIGIDGKPFSPRTEGAGLAAVKAVIEVCKAPTQERASRFFKLMLDQDRRSCKVHNDHSQITFNLDLQTNSWISREGPTGPCGTFVLGALTQDPKNHFWSYVEKTLRTNPKGVLPTGQSCSLYPEHTLNYSWHTADTMEGCEFIESFPD